MGVQTYCCLIFTLLMLLNLSQGFKFDVGGRDGWVLRSNGQESYDHWAGRNRFQVNDTLLFKFKKGNDSVLLVTKENFDTCNVKNPIESLLEGESIFKLEKSGPHYFISGNEDHCKKGQKLVVVVLATRPKGGECDPSPAPKSPTPTPVLSPPPASPSPPVSPTPTPVLSPPPASPSPPVSPVPTADAPVPSTNNTSSFATSITIVSPSMVLSVAIVVSMLLG